MTGIVQELVGSHKGGPLCDAVEMRCLAGVLSILYGTLTFVLQHCHVLATCTFLPQWV